MWFSNSTVKIPISRKIKNIKKKAKNEKNKKNQILKNLVSSRM